MFGIHLYPWYLDYCSRESKAKVIAKRFEQEAYNNMDLNDFVNKLKVCFPIGYYIDILPEADEDRICDWRRIRIIKNENQDYVDATIAPIDYDSLDLKKFVQSFVKILERKKFKMTREEAKVKMLAVFKSDFKDSQRNIDDFLDGLEILGLIKFEEDFVNVNNTLVPYKLYQEHHLSINALISAGFRFVKA